MKYTSINGFDNTQLFYICIIIQVIKYQQSSNERWFEKHIVQKRKNFKTRVDIKVFTCSPILIKPNIRWCNIDGTMYMVRLRLDAHLSFLGKPQF